MARVRQIMSDPKKMSYNLWLFQIKTLSLQPVNVLSLNDDGNTTSSKTTQKGDQG